MLTRYYVSGRWRPVFKLVLAFGLLLHADISDGAAQTFAIQEWHTEQGLPQNKVTAVVQTRDGYLWVGTYNGLARFDGVRFTVFDSDNTPELHNSRVTSLFEAEDGTLWIGDESGHVTRYKAGRFEAKPFHPVWRGGKIYDISSDEAGDVWLMNEVGELARVRDGQVFTPPAGVITNVVALARSANGQIWVDRAGWVSVLKHGQLQLVEFGATTPATYPYIQGIAASRDGGLWVACDGRIKKWRDVQWTADLGAAPWGWNIVANFAETSAGVLAGGTSSDGLWLFFTDQTNTPALHLDHTNGLPSDWVISLWEDRENNLWCGTGAGLAVIRPNNVEKVSPPDKWKGRPVLSVLPTPDGALWVGTEGAGLYRLQNGNWTNFDSARGIRNSYVWSLAADGGGEIWAGTWGGGLSEQKDDTFDFAPGLENILLPMPALLFVGNELWIGTTAGPMRYQNGRLERFSEIAGEPFGDVRTIAQDKSGALWFGTAGGGLVRRENGNFRRFKKSDGLSSNFIECLHFADDGTLWIGTFGSGLNRFKNGRFSVVNRKQGLPNGVIGHIEVDGRGFFWMSSYGGILRASENDLNRCADGEMAEAPFLTYGISDGLPTLEFSEGMQSAGAKTPDGRLWFPTAKGLVVVNPANVKTNSLPPPVVIESMRVDDRPLALENFAGAPWKIPPGRHRFEFQYTGLSFVSPEKVRFKCRLKGFDTDWVDVGTKRLAFYNYIPPGDYSFQVTACNNDGVWNETGASLTFTVLPYFWQTTWFHVLGGLATALAAGGVVWFDTRRRMRRKLERAERQRDIERERARIAHDIHDDLGAQLTQIMMLSQLANEDQEKSTAGHSQLDRIFNTASELTTSVDEIVWAVDPAHDTLDSLVSYIVSYAQEFLSPTIIRCRFELPLQLPSWPLTAEWRHNVFLAFKEALNNIVKHAHASQIVISVNVEQAAFRLTVQDNGKGFSPELKTTDSAPCHGNGLVNMQQRLDRLGGSCEVSSHTGVGVKVVFELRLPPQHEEN
jgi:signal transduction histidine kinase/ligand-binding sensor domain-containing protein